MMTIIYKGKDLGKTVSIYNSLLELLLMHSLCM